MAQFRSQEIAAVSAVSATLHGGAVLPYSPVCIGSVTAAMWGGGGAGETRRGHRSGTHDDTGPGSRQTVTIIPATQHAAAAAAAYSDNFP